MKSNPRNTNWTKMMQNKMNKSVHNDDDHEWQDEFDGPSNKGQQQQGKKISLTKPGIKKRSKIVRRRSKMINPVIKYQLRMNKLQVIGA